MDNNLDSSPANQSDEQIILGMEAFCDEQMRFHAETCANTPEEV